MILNRVHRPREFLREGDWEPWVVQELSIETLITRGIFGSNILWKHFGTMQSKAPRNNEMFRIPDNEEYSVFKI